MLHQNELIRYLRQHELFETLELPSPSNRGVIQTPEVPLVWSHLDYLSASYIDPPEQRMGKSWRLPINNHWWRADYQVSPVKPYRYGVALNPAGTLYWSDSQKNSGSLLVLGGGDMARLRREMSVSDEEIMAVVNAQARNITRLDFCSNIDRGDPRELLENWREGKVKARGKVPYYYGNEEERAGFTVYFGKPQSDKMMRVYDKAAQLKMLDGIWTRIELQVNGSPAGRMLTDMCQNGAKIVGKQAMRSFVSAPDLNWYNEALEGEDIDLRLTPAKETKFMNWLNNQVGPAIRKRIDADMHLSEITDWIDDMKNYLAE
jgi:hypothetical protein